MLYSFRAGNLPYNQKHPDMVNLPCPVWMDLWVGRHLMGFQWKKGRIFVCLQWPKKKRVGVSSTRHSAGSMAQVMTGAKVCRGQACLFECFFGRSRSSMFLQWGCSMHQGTWVLWRKIWLGQSWENESCKKAARILVARQQVCSVAIQELPQGYSAELRLSLKPSCSGRLCNSEAHGQKHAAPSGKSGRSDCSQVLFAKDQFPGDDGHWRAPVCHNGRLVLSSDNVGLLLVVGVNETLVLVTCLRVSQPSMPGIIWHNFVDAFYLTPWDSTSRYVNIVNYSTGCWFHIWFIFIPKIGEMIQFDDHIFSDGLKPPTRVALLMNLGYTPEI